MATKTNWQELYTDLPEHVAEALRAARVKPEQLTAKADGELLSIQGINDTALEAIREKYPVASVEEQPQEVKKETKKASKKAVKKEEKEATKTKARRRSKRYQAAIKNTDRVKTYSLTDALEILKKISNTKSKTLEAHLNLLEKGIRGEARLPYSTGKQAIVEVFSDDTVAKLNANQVDFDILLARPADMPKLARFAKLLGPKGLMPNPKNGTVTDKPEARAEELKKGATMAYKSEAKFPLMHLSFGSLDQEPEHITANIKATLNAIGVKKIKNAYLKTTQSPSVKLDLNSL